MKLLEKYLRLKVRKLLLVNENHKAAFNQSTELVDLPDGTYDGIRGGYIVNIPSENIKFKTIDGVRCSGCPCKVTIKDKKVQSISNN